MAKTPTELATEVAGITATNIARVAAELGPFLVVHLAAFEIILEEQLRTMGITATVPRERLLWQTFETLGLKDALIDEARAKILAGDFRGRPDLFVINGGKSATESPQEAAP